jgi:hypothetical protein
MRSGRFDVMLVVDPRLRRVRVVESPRSCRATPTGSWPAVTSSGIVARPSTPVAPVTRIFISTSSGRSKKWWVDRSECEVSDQAFVLGSVP